MTRTRLLTVLLVLGSAVITPGAGDQQSTDEPDALFRAAAQSLKEGNPQHVWMALPWSYRHDVENVVHEFGARMDPEVWSKGFQVASTALEVLDEKRNFVFAHPLIAMRLGDPGVGFGQQFDALVKAISVLANSEVKTTVGLEQLDLDRFVAETLPDVIRPIKEFVQARGRKLSGSWLEKGFETVVVARTRTTATVRVLVEEEDPRDYPVIRVGGVWVPREVADDWDQNIEKVRRELDAFVLDESTRQQILERMRAVDAMLVQMLAAENLVEFGKAMHPVVKLMEKQGK